MASLAPDDLAMPSARARALIGLATALALGDVRLDRSVDREEVRADLLRLSGVGPWTADYVRMRALGDPDIFLPGDAAARRVAITADVRLADRSVLARRAESWRPWRSYALMHLWMDVLPQLSGARERTRCVDTG